MGGLVGIDFLYRLQDRINDISMIPTLRQGYLGTGESLVIYPLPGSRVVQGYMDDTKDWAMNYEIAMKSQNQVEIGNTLWKIQTELEQLEELPSNDGSYTFEDLTITNKPFINQIDEQGWFVFLLDVQANITVLKGED